MFGSQRDQEWVEHLRKAYPDPSTMPADTKALLEKADQEIGRAGIKNLHQATKHLGKAKKHLSEVTEHRRAHRALWMSHLAAGIQMWEAQLEDFRKRQALLTEQAVRARAEITSTNQIIQQLSSRAAGSTTPAIIPSVPEEEAVEDTADKEEEGLRLKLQNVLKTCANSLGLDLEPPKTIEVAAIEEEDENEEKRQKRPRSLEPFDTAMKS